MAQPTPPNPLSQPPMMIKPENIDKLPFLDENQKEQYKNGLTGLWNSYENSPEGSEQRKVCEAKIRNASQKLMAQLRNHGRPGSGTGAGAASGAGAAVAGGTQRPNQAQHGSAQQGGAHQQQPGQAGQGTAQQMTPVQGQAQAQAQARPQAGQQGQQLSLSQPSQNLLNSVKVVKPPSMSLQQFETYQQQWRKDGIQYLARREQIMTKARSMQQQIRNMEQRRQEVPAQYRSQFDEARKALDAANQRWMNHKAQAEAQQPPQQAQQTMNAQQMQQQQQQQQQQRDGTQQGVTAPQQQQQQQQLSASQQPQSDAKAGNVDQSGTSLSSPIPNTGFQQQQQQQQQQASSQGGPNQQSLLAQQTLAQQSQQVQSSSQQQQQQQQPQSATQPLPPQGFAQQQNLQQAANLQQQQRPKINTQQLQNPGALGQQQQHTPASALPNTAGQQNPQRPQSLNHQQAMSQAASEYSRSQQQAQAQAAAVQQAQSQVPNGMPFNHAPSSASQQNTPTSLYPNLQAHSTTQTSSVNTKFPIPKTLQLDPRTQTAVAGPPSRPTLSNQGMMFNPGVTRPPPYTLEGEGDRVLSKRKLDELVRQVTGASAASANASSTATSGAPSSSSSSSSILAPEVEESMLAVADNFIDDVLTAACRLAKLRPAQTLDLRDLQIVLERNYGIRIPGYSLDEVRAVRKFQPAPGWHTKMQAVQAGKVMASRDS